MKQSTNISTNLKSKTKITAITVKPTPLDSVDIGADPFRRRDSIRRSPPLLERTGSRSSVELDLAPLKSEDDPLGSAPLEKSELERVRRERIELEEFLFADSNKINRNAVKYILAKWALLEGVLQETILEKEKLKAVNENLRVHEPKSFAQVVAGSIQ